MIKQPKLVITGSELVMQVLVTYYNRVMLLARNYSNVVISLASPVIVILHKSDRFQSY